MQTIRDDPVLFSKGLFWTPAMEHSLQKWLSASRTVATAIWLVTENHLLRLVSPG